MSDSVRSRRLTAAVTAALLFSFTGGSGAQDTPKPRPPRPGAPPVKKDEPAPATDTPSGPAKPPGPGAPKPAPDAPKPEPPAPDAPEPDQPGPRPPKPGAPAPAPEPTPVKPEPDAPPPDDAPGPRPPGPRPPKPGAGTPAPTPAPKPEQPAEPPRPGDSVPPGPATPEPTDRPVPPPAPPAKLLTDRDRGFLPVEDRWRVRFPEWRRYENDTGETPYTQGSLLDPYGQNILKGDYPILRDDIFAILRFESDTLFEGRSFPIASGVSTQSRNSPRFFGEPHQFLLNQNFTTSVELFKGDTAFKPKDIVLRVTPVYNVNYLRAFERNLVNINPQNGDDRVDGHVGLQEAFLEYHLTDLSPSYDFLTVIAGIQPFTSDFRGFLFSENNLGVRLQGNYLANRLQWNLAWFHQLEKDTNSGLNDYKFRDQDVFIANLFVQDFGSELSDKFLGYTLGLSWHLNLDQSHPEYDTNGFIVRPAKIGTAGIGRGVTETKQLEVHYLGVGGDGHIGPVNLTHQYYCALGNDSNNEIAGKRQSILAHFAAVEASVDVDWLRFKGSFLYASGDGDPTSGRATGFDTIFDNPFFAGAGFSYFNRQNIPLAQTGVQLVNRLSLVPNLRSSKTQGQANFVNPGLLLYNVGVSAKVTPKLFLDLNVNWLQFDRTEVLQRVLVQDRIHRDIGLDLGLGLQYRPLLTENIIFTAGASSLIPGHGFRDIYERKTLYSGFVSMTFTY